MSNGSSYPERWARMLELRLQRVYRGAQKGLEKAFDEFLKQHRKKGAEMLKKVANGEITQQQYADWMKREVAAGKEWQKKIDDATDLLKTTNEKALTMIRGEQLNVFSDSANREAFEIEKDFKGAVSFEIYDQQTVERLVEEKPELMPRKILNGRKDKAWNQGLIANALATAIVRGESIPDLARRLAHDTANSDMKAMVRYARTAMTNAQNAGRIETMHQAQGLGIKVQKEWISTLDRRTRDSHRHLDGQIRDVDKPFESELGKIMFPGDPEAAPGDVWNCRCTLGYHYPEYPNKQAERLDNETRETIKDMTYDEWMKKKGEKGKTAQAKAKKKKAKESKATAIGSTNQQPNETKTAEQKNPTSTTELKKMISEHKGPWDEKSIREVGHKAAEVIEARRKEEKYYELAEEAKKLEEEVNEKARRITETWKEYHEAHRRMDPDEQKKKEIYDKAIADHSEASARFEAANRKKEECSSRIIKGVISEIRDVGGLTKEDGSAYSSTGRQSKVTDSLVDAFNLYPRSWIMSSDAHRVPIKPKWSTGRQHYIPGNGEILISDRIKSNVHELGHRFEETVKGIKEAEKEFYDRRTAGEKEEWLGPGYKKTEKTKRDKFLDPYMGKVYNDGYELVSMGFPMAFYDYDKLSEDEEYRDFIIGLLVGV